MKALRLTQEKHINNDGKRINVHQKFYIRNELRRSSDN